MIEDHADTGEVFQRFLSKNGYDVSIVGDCASALRVARATEFDVVVSDIMLPDGNGWDLLAKLRAIRPSLRAIAVTALGQRSEIARCKEAGFDAYLLKPITLTTLLETIQCVCAGIVGLFPEDGSVEGARRLQHKGPFG